MALLFWIDRDAVNAPHTEVPVSFLALEFDVTLSENHGITAQVTQHPIENGVDITDHIKPELQVLSFDALVTNTPLNDVLLNPNTVDPVTTRNAAELRLLDYPRVIQIDTQRQIQPGRVILPQVSHFKFPGIKRASSPAQAFPGTWVTDTSFLASRLKGSNLDVGAKKIDRVKDVFGVLERLVKTGTPVQVITDLKTYENMVLTSVQAPVKPEDAITFSIVAQEYRTAVVGITSITKSKVKKPAEKRAAEVEDKGPTGSGYALNDDPRLQSDLVRIKNAVL